MRSGVCPTVKARLMAASSKSPSQTIISSNHIKNDDVSKLWEILGRIADDPNNPLNPSQDAEIFIGYYE